MPHIALQSMLDPMGTSILKAYYAAYDTLRDPKRTQLWELVNNAFPMLIGSSPINDAALKTISTTIDKISFLSQPLANAMLAKHKALAKAVQVLNDERLAQSLTEGTQPSEPEQKKKEEAARVALPSSIKKVNIVWIPVRPQTDATCGLHAVNNTHELHECLLKKLSEAQYKERMIKPLTGVALELSKLKESNMLDPLTLQQRAHALGISPESYSMLPNAIQNTQDFTAAVPMPTAQSPFIPANLGIALEALNTKPEAVHNFVLGTMTINPVTMSGSNGHWIGVTAHKTGDTLTLYAMDSMNNRLEDLVNALRDIITKANYNALKLTYNITERFDHVRAYQDASDYAGMLAELTEIIQMAKAAGILNSPNFKLTLTGGTSIPVKKVVEDYLKNITVLNRGEWAAHARKALAELNK